MSAFDPKRTFGPDVLFADLPAIEGPTGRFMLQQMAAVAELEAGLISHGHA
jgi:DNA invertase Pin-like site-specific DNA recombinase